MACVALQVLTIERIHSRDQQPYWFIGLIPRKMACYTNMAAVSLFWTNMAAVKSCEYAP